MYGAVVFSHLQLGIYNIHPSGLRPLLFTPALPGSKNF
jgi:hypothetical protein